MASRDIWFGTREFMRWVPAWAPGQNYGRQSHQSDAGYLNGGAGGRTSLTSARTYDLAWPTRAEEAHRKLTDFADGVYGKGLIYWSDPTNQSVNVLPQRWATPWLATEDATPLIRRARPSLVSTPSMARNYPPYGARYTKQAGDVADGIFIPIPPGYTAWVGVHGNAAADGVVVARPYVRTVQSGVASRPEVLTTDTGVRVNTPIVGGDQSWINLTLDLDAIPDGASFDLYGLIVQILPSGQSPLSGDFASGQGHSGAKWRLKPTLTPYSTVHDQYGLSASLYEAGSWL